MAHVDEILDALADGIERGDLDAVGALYADDVQVWDNVTCAVADKGRALKLLSFWSKAISERKYEILERLMFLGGAVQRHVIRGVTSNGTALAAHACIIVHIEHDRIVRIDEYVDSAAVAPAFGRD